MKMSIKKSMKFMVVSSAMIMIHSLQAESCEKQVDWANLPKDPLKYLLRFLPAKDLANISLVCQNWKNAANDPVLWKYKVLKEYRNDAKNNTLGVPESRLNDHYLSQLIARLNKENIDNMKQQIQNRPTINGEDFFQRCFRSLIGVDHNTFLDDEKTFEEITAILSYEKNINVNRNYLFNSVITSNNFRLVKLFMSFGAKIDIASVRSASENPEIFEFLLKLYPLAYLQSDLRKEMSDYFEMMRFELGPQQDRLKKFLKCEEIYKEYSNNSEANIIWTMQDLISAIKNVDILSDDKFVEIEKILKSNSININIGIRSVDDFATPFLLVTRTKNLNLIKLFLDNGAKVTLAILKDCFESPEVLEYLLNVDPSFYQNKELFDNLMDHFTNVMEFELKRQEDRFQLLKRCQDILRSKR